jgi:tetratricopeptide (TPR) repeat protein
MVLLFLAPAVLPADGAGLESFERAAELSPQDPGAQFNFGVMCLKAGDYARAAGALKKATSLAPTDAESWEAYGTALVHLQRIPEAVQALQRSTSLDDKRAGAWQELGQALAEAQDASGHNLASAVSAYAQAARLKPGDPRPLLNEGLLLAKLGRDPEAVQVLLKASGMDAGQAAFRDLCMLYNKAGDYAQAEAACRRAVQTDSGAESWYNLGFALQGLGKKDEARTAYQNALKADPGHATSLYALAFMDFQAGDAEAALSGFQAALKARNGDYPEAAYNAAVLLGDQGRYEDAAGLYRSFLKTHPDDQDAQTSLKSVVEAGLSSLLGRGQDAYERGDVAEAREAWERARALDPSNGEAGRMLKLTQVQGGGAAVTAARKSARTEVAQRLKAEDTKMKKRGLAAFQGGKDAEAARLLGFYLRNNPGDGSVEKALIEARGRMRAAVDALLRQASADLKAGDNVMAGNLAGLALEQDPGNARARALQREAGRSPAKKLDQDAVRKLYYDGVEQYLAGDLKGAVATWTKVLKQQPDHLDAQRSLARAELELQALKRLDKH